VMMQRTRPLAPRRGVALLVSALTLTASGAAGTALVAPAQAAAATVQTTSANWAGYAVRRTGVRFRTVSGTWTVPRVDCSDGVSRSSANWVGIGGYSPTARALEQLGTESDCTRGGREVYSAWFEVVPDSATTSRLTVTPGDTVRASVQVRGTLVTMKLADLARGTSQTRVVRADTVDQTSAEWIVEAPSICSGDTIGDANCRQTALANFGTTGFSAARATTSAGHTGTVADPTWTTVAIVLRAQARGGPGFLNGHGGPPPNATAGGATPGALDVTGGAFSVAFGETQAVSPAAPA